MIRSGYTIERLFDKEEGQVERDPIVVTRMAMIELIAREES